MSVRVDSVSEEEVSLRFLFPVKFRMRAHHDGCNLQNVFDGHNIIPNGYDSGR
jgi:hypothetical protein